MWKTILCNIFGHRFDEYHLYEVVCSRCRVCKEIRRKIRRKEGKMFGRKKKQHVEISVEVVPAYRICPNCKREVLGEYCYLCGTKTAEKACPNGHFCGLAVNFCPECGAETAWSSNPERKAVSNQPLVAWQNPFQQQYQQLGQPLAGIWNANLGCRSL